MSPVSDTNFSVSDTVARGREGLMRLQAEILAIR